MLKTSFYLLLLIFIASSCRRGNEDSVAAHICACYDSIHSESVRVNNEEELEAKVKACNDIFAKTLDSFENDAEKKAEFIKAFRACQEQ